jgi:hypothetical protein
MLGVIDDLEPEEVRDQDAEQTEQDEASQPRPLAPMDGVERRGGLRDEARLHSPRLFL